jgi:FKBP-type peptidyl-prolyl cis-trans isomerase
MRIIILAAIGSMFVAFAAQAQQGGQAQPPGQDQAPPAIELKTNKQKASYGIGLNIGNNMRRAGFELDLAVLVRGLQDALSGAKPALEPQAIQDSIAAVQQEAAAVQAERAKQLAAKNKEDAARFLAENKQRQGVITLPSGLQYKVLKTGTGLASPKATDTVSTHYKGTLLDGTVFDSSYDRGQPASFGVNQVIPGWTEALQKMKVGDKWQLFIPAELGYGERGTPNGEIGPNATLVFDIELLGIEPPKPANQ